MAKKDDYFRRKVESHWNIPGLVQELCDAAWHNTEPHRYDRMISIGSWWSIMELTKDIVPEEEWKDAKREGFEHEFVDDYLETLSSIVSEKGKCVQVRIKPGKKEWRPGKTKTMKPIGHVYGTYEDGDCFLGQYEEDVTAEELRAMGFEVEE